MPDDYEYLLPNYPIKDVFPFENTSSPQRTYKIPKNRPVRIYCDGIYDLFHYGHAWSLRQAKHLFPNVYLIVGICSDTITHKNKGKTVLTDKERYETVRHCKYVNEIIEDAPWVVDMSFITKHEIDFIAHDDIPFMYDNRDVYEEFKNKGVFVPTKRTAGISTSGLITRIVKDYDEFVRRNLERGVSAKDLNVSRFDENMFRVRKRVREVKKKAEDEIEEMREEIRIALRFWENMGKEFVARFEDQSGSDEGFWKKLKNVLSSKKEDKKEEKEENDEQKEDYSGSNYGSNEDCEVNIDSNDNEYNEYNKGSNNILIKKLEGFDNFENEKKAKKIKIEIDRKKSNKKEEK
ncbi:choline-phosphate cytidylyltransferase [Conglomerata obtusa]